MSPSPWAGKFPPEPCPRCHGTGRMYRRAERIKEGGTWVRCTRCRGSGACPRRPPELSAWQVARNIAAGKAK